LVPDEKTHYLISPLPYPHMRRQQQFSFSYQSESPQRKKGFGDKL